MDQQGCTNDPQNPGKAPGNYRQQLLGPVGDTGKVATVSRATNQSSTIMGDATVAEVGEEEALVNGTVARVMLSTFFDFAEMSGLVPVPIKDVQGPLRYVDPNDIS